jgi:transcription elongation factor Elf1
MPESARSSPPTYITPVTCPHCGGQARLMRRTPDPQYTGGEIRTFECDACGKQTEMRTE